MKIPKSIRIGGVEYTIIEDTPTLNDGVHLLYGEINYTKSVIQLSDSCQGQQMKCITLLHEILHGIRNHAGAKIENEEEVVEMFGRGLYQVLQDNSERLFES